MTNDNGQHGNGPSPDVLQRTSNMVRRQGRGKANGRKSSRKARRERQSPVRAAGGAVRRRGPKPYPVVAFKDALTIPNGIMEHAAGDSVRRERLLGLMGLPANSQPTRDLITNSSKYKISVGNHRGVELKLTEKGRLVVDPSSAPREKRRAAFDLAIAEIEPFKHLYDKYAGKAMPSLEVMQDELDELDPGDRKPCVDVFVANAMYIGLLKTADGAKRLLTIDDALDELARAEPRDRASHAPTASDGRTGMTADAVDFSKTCFFIAPIGDKASTEPKDQERRRHSDTILNQYISRALEEQQLAVVRADAIAEAGMISKQIIEYILKSRLVIADLSYHNPNVFYELCLRHVTGLPTVHLIRKGDKIPFDLANFRTITIALDDVHDAIAEIDIHRAEIANYVRQALNAGQSKDNPILTFHPEAQFMTESSPK